VDDNNDYLPPNEALPDQDVSWVLGNAQTDVTTTNIQNGLIFRYHQQVKIYVCPANTLMIPDGNGGHAPQTRTCSVDFALGGYTPPTAAARSMALPPWSNSAKFSPAAPAWRKKLCLWTRPKTAWTMAALEFIRKARGTTLGGTLLVAGMTAKEQDFSPLPMVTRRFGDGRAAR